MTKEQLVGDEKTSSYVDRSVERKLGDDVGGILVSGTKSNSLYLKNGTSTDMMVYRQWQAVGNTMQNPFLEPDFHYTITTIGGEQTDGISIEEYGTDEAGKLTLKLSGKTNGTYIVTVY